MQRRKFGREFKIEAARLVRERGVSVAQAARDLDVHENVLRKWVKEFAADPGQAFPGQGQMKPEQLEIERLRPLPFPDCSSRRNGADAMRALRVGAPEVSAVLCFSDLLAAGALKQLAEDGVLPGRDISVVGFDDLEEASYLMPPLTTVRLDQALLGETAAQLLLDRIDAPTMPRKVVTIAAELVIRGTTGRNRRPEIAP